jgi:hypothetical protein
VLTEGRARLGVADGVERIAPLFASKYAVDGHQFGDNIQAKLSAAFH